MVVKDTGPPSSLSAGFLKRNSIPCLHNSFFDLLVCVHQVIGTWNTATTETIKKDLVFSFTGGFKIDLKV